MFDYVVAVPAHSPLQFVEFSMAPCEACKYFSVIELFASGVYVGQLGCRIVAPGTIRLTCVHEFAMYQGRDRHLYFTADMQIQASGFIVK